MPHLETLRECYRHTAWTWAALLDCARPLTPAQLDQTLEMGPGALRKTLQHIYGAERIWYERWGAADAGDLPHSSDLTDLAALDDAATDLRRRRDGFLSAGGDDGLARRVDYIDPLGTPYGHRLGDLALHVYNHGVYHAAQAVNMLRRLGSKLPEPGVDYIFYKIAAPSEPALSAGALRRYYDYADWARGVVDEACSDLTDAELDRVFALGLGCVRATLLHIRFGEQWWLNNWTRGPDEPFPELPADTPLPKLQALFAETARRRDEILDASTDDDLKRPIAAKPAPDIVRTFPLGVTMLELCMHGTHHRAQIVNMLRQLGRQPPKIDYAQWIRTGA
jgi:uncharacterized damage-inducible protein DinB